MMVLKSKSSVIFIAALAARAHLRVPHQGIVLEALKLDSMLIQCEQLAFL
jgi:hypothetical protein